MRMTIEKALEWAYREELPKAEPDWGAIGLSHAPRMANASAPMASFGENPSEAVEARMNCWGVVAVKTLFGSGPHSDAVQIGLAVDALCAEAVTMAAPEAVIACGHIEGARAIDDGELVLWMDAVTRAAARLPRRLKDIIIRHALTRDAGHWQGEPVQMVPVRDQFGNARWFRMVEREAVTRRGQKMGVMERVEMIVDIKREPRRRPRPDCYQKFRLEPDPVWMIEARAVYAAWRAALDVLFEDLEGRLEKVTLLPSEAPRAPWNEAEAA